MLRYHSKTNQIKDQNDYEAMERNLTRVKPKYGAFDTETTGLHIIKDTPFLVQVGFISEPNKTIYVYLLDVQNKWSCRALRLFLDRATQFEKLIGHNVIFDLHMLHNIGFIYRADNITDTQFYIRYAHDALHFEEGGPRLGLKDYATHYIDPKAKNYEKKVKETRKLMAKIYNAKLSQALKTAGSSLKELMMYFKDPLFEVDDLPRNIRDIYITWRAELPLSIAARITSVVNTNNIPYNLVDKKVMYEYAHYDVVYTLEIFRSLQHIIEGRHQEIGLSIEEQLIYPLLEMERVGFNIDQEYLEQSRLRLKNYIKQQREVLYEVLGEHITIGQHAKIKELLRTLFNLNLASTGSDQLKLELTKLDNPDTAKVINLILELRTLEKWYSTYILRFQNELKRCNKLYPKINQVGTVSGRVSSDFQQFPKQAILDKDGNELFHPRKMITPTPGKKLVCIDYSQIELRIQAMYTILVGNPDINLCRAYMPYQMDPEDWSPVDVHGATTTEATGLKPGDPEFKRARAEIGKRVNFAKNYGAQLNRIKQMFPDKTHEECVRIDQAYYKAFPGIKSYHTYCAQRAQKYSNTENLFGVRYYNVSGHKLKNLLIQGSAAYLLKTKIIEIYHYLKLHNYDMKFQMQIHDELVFEYGETDDKAVQEIRAIMEDWEDSLIPIVADVEYSSTNWAEKGD